MAIATGLHWHAIEGGEPTLRACVASESHVVVVWTHTHKQPGPVVNERSLATSWQSQGFRTIARLLTGVVAAVPRRYMPRGTCRMAHDMP